jgi:hypothetical protein
MKGYVVFSARAGQKRMYLGQENTWWADLKQARIFSELRLAQLELKRSEVATGCEPYESAKWKAEK